MGLDDFVSCIELLKDRIRSHGDALREDETRTRMALIDPLLRALGWDISDPGVVMPEYKVGNGRADYALLRPDGKPAATVEAKRLGAVPFNDKIRRQMLTYANEKGIAYAGLTDGDHWELYNIFQQAPLEERRILQVSIADEPAHGSALKLLLLWRPNVASGQQPIAANRPLVSDSGLASPSSEAIEPAERPSTGWVRLSEYDPPVRTPCPTAIRFWDGTQWALTYWYDVLTCVVRKLHADGHLTPKAMSSGQQQHIHSHGVHTAPMHRTGKPFMRSQPVEGTPFVVEVNRSARDLRAKAKGLLRYFQRDPADVYLSAGVDGP